MVCSKKLGDFITSNPRAPWNKEVSLDYDEPHVTFILALPLTGQVTERERGVCTVQRRFDTLDQRASLQQMVMKMYQGLL